ALCRPQGLFTFPKISDEVFGLACSPNGRLVAAGEGGEAAIRLIDIVSCKDVGTLERRNQAGGAAYGIAFDPAGKRLLSTTSGETWDLVSKTIVGVVGGAVQVWDLEHRSNLTNLLHRFQTVATAFSPDGTLIIASACDGLYNRTDPGELVLWSGITYE